MTNENNQPPNIPYSIWQTRTEEIDPKVKEKMADSAKKMNPKKK